MTSAEFRNALAKLRFLELPKLINLTLYPADLAADWRDNPVRGFSRLSQPDRDKVFAEICDNGAWPGKHNERNGGARGQNNAQTPV